MNGKKIYPSLQKRLTRAILTLLLGSLLSIFTVSCKKTVIKTLPVDNTLVPIQMLFEDSTFTIGNYEVSKGYVIKHVALIAENRILKERIKEMQKEK